MTDLDGVRLHHADAQELIETLQFIDDWLSRNEENEEQVRASLARFAGIPGYGIPQLRDDLLRFAFLLGADNSDRLFGGK